MDDELKICLVGASGRMGLEIAARVEVVCGLIDRAASERLSPGDFKFPIGDSYSSEWPSPNIVVDFSTPAGTEKARAVAAGRGLPLLVGTTGLDDAQLAALRRDSSKIPVLVSSNYSLGINVLQYLVEEAAKMLPNADIEILDLHHRAKVDAPSGTAFMLADAVAAGRGLERKQLKRVTARDAIKSARSEGEVGMQALRGGSAAGEHTVYLLCDAERLELTHRAAERSIFADGAVRAARWLVQQPAGFYSMRDVLRG